MTDSNEWVFTALGTAWDITLSQAVPEVLQASVRGELDRIEQESLAFFERTRERYLSLAAVDATIKTIDASQSLEQVAADIRHTLIEWIEQQRKQGAQA